MKAEQRDQEFAEWLSDWLGDRLELLARGDTPERKEARGSGWYCRLEGRSYKQWELCEILHTMKEPVAATLESQGKAHLINSYRKACFFHGGQLLMRRMRKIRSSNGLHA